MEAMGLPWVSKIIQPGYLLWNFQMPLLRPTFLPTHMARFSSSSLFSFNLKPSFLGKPSSTLHGKWGTLWYPSVPWMILAEFAIICHFCDYLIDVWLPLQTLWGWGLRGFYSPLYPLALRLQVAHRTQLSKYHLKEWNLRYWVSWFQSSLPVLTNFESIYENLVSTTTT